MKPTKIKLPPVKIEPVDKIFVRDIIRRTLDIPKPPKQKTELNEWSMIINITMACREYKEVRMGYYWNTILQWIEAMPAKLSKDEYADQLAKTVVLFTESLRANNEYLSGEAWKETWQHKKPEYSDLDIPVSLPEEIKKPPEKENEKPVQKGLWD